MASRHWETAQAVAAAIAAGTFSEPLAVARAAGYPRYALADLATLRVDVIPVGPAPSARKPRGASERHFPLNIVVQQTCEPGDDANFARLMNLMEEIQNFVEDTPIAGFGRPVDDTATAHDPEMLERDGRFLGAVAVTYYAVREAGA
jgi:hypothetical protein